MARKNDERSSDPLSSLAESTASRFAAKASYQDVLDQRGNALMAVNEKSGERSKAYMAVEQHLDKNEKELERIKISLRRPISMLPVRPVVLVIIGLGLALLEAPANKFLFDVALQSSGLASYGASAVTTAFLLIFAHFAGVSIRQVWSEYRKKLIFGNIPLFLVCVGIALTIISILTVARAAFANETGSIGDLLSTVGGGLGNLGFLGALTDALADKSALVLACINIGGVVTTMVLAFFSHDSDRDFDHAHRATLADERELAKIHGKYLEAKAKIVGEFAPDLVGYAANYNSANGHVIELKTRLGRPLDDDDRFVLTDLDQMSEDAERKNHPAGSSPPPRPPLAGVEHDATVSAMSDYRRAASSEAP